MKTVLTRAIEFATEKHEGQIRKDGVTPFIEHPVSVGLTVKKMTGDDMLAAVGVLHDTVEDTDATLDDIRMHFGEEIAHYVDIESEDKREHMSAEDSWRDRKEEQIIHFKNLAKEDYPVINVAFADKFDNLQSLVVMKTMNGDIWSQGTFNNNNPEDQYWYYNSFYELFRDSEVIKPKYLEEMKDFIDFIFDKK